MPQQILTQEQRQIQTQKLTPLQYLVTKMVEMPLVELERCVHDEIDGNVALEDGAGADAFAPDADVSESDGFSFGDDADAAASDDGYGQTDEVGERIHADSMYDSEDLPVHTSSSSRDDRDRPVGDTGSFFEELVAQIADFDVDDAQRELIEYLIYSLNDRGFVDRPLINIADDLLFHHGIEASIDDLEAALQVLQQFDPCGIGARNLQECLLLQLDRKDTDAMTEAEQRSVALQRTILQSHFELFERNDPQRLAAVLGVEPSALRHALEAIRRLNPHPGRALGESSADRSQTVTPDFFVETDHESSISFTLNVSHLPRLRVNSYYSSRLQALQGKGETMTRSDREGYVWAKQMVESAQDFISALQQRQQTLSRTMRAIIHAQREFMLTQDDFTLRPLSLSDVAAQVGVDISVISRVVNNKYVELDGTIYPLSHFFQRQRKNADGVELNKHVTDAILREIVDAEDKTAPLPDEVIAARMCERGIRISRRTVTKYRDKLGIPSANLRRKI